MQTELAAAAGCSVNTVRKLESDERKPSRELAARLASVFDLAQHDRADFLRQARGTPHLGRASLLAPMTRLIGRESELSAIRARLLSPEVRLLTLVGPPGVGKTRLALQVATDMQVAFRATGRRSLRWHKFTSRLWWSPATARGTTARWPPLGSSWMTASGVGPGKEAV